MWLYLFKKNGDFVTSIKKDNFLELSKKASERNKVLGSMCGSGYKVIEKEEMLDGELGTSDGKTISTNWVKKEPKTAREKLRLFAKKLDDEGNII